MELHKDTYFTNLLNEGSNLDGEFVMQSEDQMGRYLNQNAQVHVQTSQVPTEMGSTVKKSRGGNFTIQEDNLLVSGWLGTTLDAVQGNDQKSKTYWSRVQEYFNQHKNFISDRNPNSLMHRWSIIQLATNKFCGCFAQIQSRHQSGVNEQDEIDQAKFLYKELHKSSFLYEHSWKLLRFHPKWLEECLQKKKPRKNIPETYSSPSTIDSINLGDDEASPDTFVSLDRPPGKKAEKERLKKRKKTDCEISPSPLAEMLDELMEDKKKTNEKKMDILQKAYLQDKERLLHEKERIRQEEERLRQEQEKIAIKQELLRVEQLKEEERIMLMDTSGMSEMLQQYYRRRQMEISDNGKIT